MHNYLSDVTANYFYTLDIPNQVTMPITGKKSQVIHEFDDGSVVVVGLSSQSFYDVGVEWKYIRESNKAIIMELWNNPIKADGMRRTFYWKNPVDEHLYTVRFLSDLTNIYRPGIIRSISTVTLRVEGNKP